MGAPRLGYGGYLYARLKFAYTVPHRLLNLVDFTIHIVYNTYMKKYSTFYLDADIVEWLNELKNKSRVVNQALREYNDQWKTKNTINTFARPEPLVETPAYKKAVAKKLNLEAGTKLCKAGHIADDTGRCLAKDCKFSVYLRRPK